MERFLLNEEINQEEQRREEEALQRIIDLQIIHEKKAQDAFAEMTAVVL
jgi:hypothetical protein